MAIVNVTPIVLNDIDLVIGADNYEVSVSKAELVPTMPTVTWKGMSPTAVQQLAGAATWVLNIDYAQDHATASSLSQYLLTNAGTVKTIKLKPKKGTGMATYTIDALIVPGPIGGSVDQIATGSVSLPCNGAPVRTVV
ncbi:hypothetical protein RWH45_10635 [Microbacterium sp. KSW4-17]|uniref:Phage tail protein n=1 Tax=Microbacterium galbum TaxID=3075994 RepID=A0ABU3T8I2_9MICO|nr:hypothetical protein [Microbacterium sp. KSW4-17]MDU0367674.1 hypothetical protein [Microbacterium sp. KSW4-17]